MNDSPSCVVPASSNVYGQFISSHYSPNTFLLVIAGNLMYNIAVFSHVDTFTVIPTRTTTRWTVEMISLVIRVAVFILLWGIWFLKSGSDDKLEDSPRQADEITKKNISVLSTMQALYPIMMCVALSIHVLLDTFETVFNNAPLDLDSLNVALSGLKLYPLVTFFLLRDTKFEAIVSAWAFGLIILLICAVQLRSRDHLTDFISFSFCSSVVIFDSVRQRNAMRQIVMKLQASLELNEKLAVEAQALELRAMIGNVAHDLKTPLTSLLSGIECMSDILVEWASAMSNPTFDWTAVTIQQARVANAEMQECLQNMNSTNSFMTMTINRCLDYTKTTNGFKLVPKFETVSLKSALDMPAKLVEGAQQAISINVNNIALDICSHIITDKQWLIENLLCLLSNAAKYSSRGQVDVDVFAVTLSSEEVAKSPRSSTRAKSEVSDVKALSQYLRFEVQDVGIGLSDEAMQGLFNPFKQAQRLAGGTGLGLYSLAKRVEALQGQFGVMRRLDGEQGSVFWFTIPYRPDEMSAKLLKQRAGVMSLSDRMSPPLSCTVSNDSGTVEDREPVFELPTRVEGPFNVLVVDDAPLIVKMTTMLLQRKGHTVQHAVNGADALEKLMVLMEGSTPRMSMDVCDDAEADDVPDAPLFDVVLMDLQMPVLDGIEAIRRLRAAEGQKWGPLGGANRHRPYGRQFVIALSANSDEETRQEALAAGADAFVPKPFTYESFMDVMQMQI